MRNDEVVKPDQDDSGEVITDNSCDSEEINDLTGEVIEKPKFRSMWFNPFGCATVDCSSHFEESFVELPPYAVDPKTGEFLNNSSVPKLISKGKIDVWERIQSFKKEVDLYSILEKFAYSGDSAWFTALYEIDYIENQLKNYDLQVAYSTLYITVTETKEYTILVNTILVNIDISINIGILST